MQVNDLLVRLRVSKQIKDQPFCEKNTSMVNVLMGPKVTRQKM